MFSKGSIKIILFLVLSTLKQESFNKFVYKI